MRGIASGPDAGPVPGRRDRRSTSGSNSPITASSNGGSDGGGYGVFPSLAECPADESFRTFRENTAYENVRRMFTHPNRLDDVHIDETVERWKGEWERRPPSESGVS